MHHGPKSHTGRLLKRDIKRAEAEMERRNNESGAVPANSTESPQTPLDTVSDDADRKRFSSQTSDRLRDWLDSCRYEVGKYGPESVTHQEAARDIWFIEEELRRRQSKAKTAAR